MTFEDLKKEITQHGDSVHVDLWYPRTENPIKAIQVGLMDVRAADDIRVEYDFNRDGWVIKQAQIFQWEADDEVCDPKWTEVAFIQAWASEHSLTIVEPDTTKIQVVQKDGFSVGGAG